MNQKLTNLKYYCKHCGTIEVMPSKEYGVKMDEIKDPYCPFCLAKNKRRKMIKVQEEKQPRRITEKKIIVQRGIRNLKNGTRKN